MVMTNLHLNTLPHTPSIQLMKHKMTESNLPGADQPLGATWPFLSAHADRKLPEDRAHWKRDSHYYSSIHNVRRAKEREGKGKDEGPYIL